MVKLAHIVNPVRVGEESDLFFAQPVTFKTMAVARDFAKDFGVEVELFSAQYPEDRSMIPDTFIKTPDLGRSVLDFGEFKKPRKLPLIKDILDRLYQNTDADYLIYTNVDIALMPNFYVTVNQLIEQGYDAFFINRRTISKEYSRVEEFPLMYSEAGEKHPGYDCFVFNRAVYPKYDFGKACIGSGAIGKAILINLICYSKKLGEFRDQHLTFHIGNDRNWKQDQYQDYKLFNVKEVASLCDRYEKSELLSDHFLLKKIIKTNDKQLQDFQRKSFQFPNFISLIVRKIRAKVNYFNS